MNLDPDTLKSILQVNGLSIDSPTEEIKQLLAKANYSSEEVETALAQLRGGQISDLPISATSQGDMYTLPTMQDIPTQPLKVGKLRASWMLTKACFEILAKDKLLLVFPLLEAFFVSLFAIVFFGTLFGIYISHIINIDTIPVWLLIIPYFLLYLGGYFISIFFRTAMMSIVLHIVKGEGDTSFFSGFGTAITRLGSLSLWALVAATVGVVVEILESNRKGIAGALEYGAGKALEVSWRIGSNFALPAILIENANPFEAMKTSISTLKRTWGESLFLYVGTGLFFGLLFALLMLCIAAEVFAIVYFGLPIVILYILGVVDFVALVVLITISSAADSIFKIVVYEYAALHESAKGFTPELLALSMGQ